MQLATLSDKILYHLNEPVLSFDTNGLVVYRNRIAESLNQFSEIIIQDELEVPIFTLIELKRDQITSKALVRKVEIVSEEFSAMFFELNLYYDESEAYFHCHFRDITDKVELEGQVATTKSIIEDHIEELTSANDVLKRQNEIIKTAQEEARSGLRYGKLIQDRINLNERELSRLFPNSFSIYKPQNLIGGDLIWAKESKLGKMIGVIDCMGHGVPGAMLAMSVFNFFNAVASNNKFESVTEFLCRVVKIYHKSFFQFAEEKGFRDTFDVSLVTVDEKSNLIRYRGIKRPILIERNGELIEYKGERYSVANPDTYDRLRSEPWDIVWPYKDGDKLYMFSDGFSDQFGGVNDKKYKYNNFKKFIQSISRKPISHQKSMLENELWEWQNTLKSSFDQTDDITVVGIQL